MATMPAPVKPPVNDLDQTTQSPAAQSNVRPNERSALPADPPSLGAPVGVLEVPVVVRGSRRVFVPGQPERLEQFSEKTATIIVFPNGAVIRLSATLAPGQMVVVANLQSHQEVVCRVVNVKHPPNVKGYVEIQFTQPTNRFWGVYPPQGSLNAPGAVETPAATAKQPVKPQPVVSAPASPLASRPAPASVPTPAVSAAPRREPAGLPAPPDDFWSTSFPTEILAPAPEGGRHLNAPRTTAAAPPVPAATPATKARRIEAPAIQTPSIQKTVQSPAAAALPSASRVESMQKVSGATSPVSLATASPSEVTQPSRSELELVEQGDESTVVGSRMSSLDKLLDSRLARRGILTATASARSSSRTTLVVGAVVTALLVLGATGIFFFHRGTAQPAATPHTSPAPPASVVSTAPDAVQGVPPASTPALVASRPPIAVKTNSRPLNQARDSAVSVSSSQPASQPSTRKPAWVQKIPKGKLVSSRASLRRSAAAIAREAPPDVTAVASNAAPDAAQGILAASSKIPFLGGRLKEPQLVSKVPPIYPPAARQIHLEGSVVIRALIDTTGKLTNLRVVSGPPLLQNAALDSVRQWKYQPRYLDDKPIPAEMLITVEFHLR